MIVQYHSFNILAILFSAGSCYFNTLNGIFVFDDTEAVLKNPDLNLNNSISNIFYNDFWGTNIISNNSHKSYRPLTVLFYRMIIYNAGSKNPFYFHLINIMLYIIVCITLYMLLSTILIESKRNVAFSTAMLFSIHPVHSEVVCSIVGLADLLCAFTFYLALLFYNKSVVNSSLIYYCITLLLSGISMLCKETGITVLGVCCLYDSLIRLTNSKKYSYSKYLIRQVGLVITALSFLYLRWKIMNFTEPTFQPVDNPASFAENFLTRVLSYNYIYFLNILLLLWPHWLCFDWSMGCIPLLEHFSDIRFIPVILFWILAIIFVSMQLKKRAQVPLVALIILVLTFLPASNLWLRVGFVIAERTLFLPSLGFCLLVCCGFYRICHTFSKYKQLWRGCFMLLCVLFMTRTWQRSKDWLNEYDLFVSALIVCPNNAKVHYNIAKVAADMNDIRLSESEYRKALQLYPEYDQALNNLANLLRDLGYLKEAKQLLTKAVHLRSDFAAAWMNLGIVLATLDQNEDAEKAYLTALKHRRNFSDCFYNLGNLYLKIHRNEEALRVWERAVMLNPLHSAAWSNTLVLLDGMGLHGKVLEVGQEALIKCSTSAAIHFTLGNTLGKLERWQEAEHHFQKAIEINRGNALYYSNFGVLYHRWGKLDKAVDFYEQALRLDPHLASAVNNLKKLKSNLI